MLRTVFITALAIAEVCSHFQESPLRGSLHFQEEAKFVHSSIDAMLTDPSTLGQAKRVVQQMEALVATPKVQEQMKVVADNVEVDVQEQMKLLTQNLEMNQMQGDLEQAKYVEEQMKQILVESVTKQLRALTPDATMSDPKLQMQSSQDKMVDQMLDRGLKASSLEHAHFQNTMLGKPSSLATQPGMKVNSVVVPPSMHASSARSAIRANAIFSPKQKAIAKKVDQPKRTLFGRSPKPPEPEPEPELPFWQKDLTDEDEENIRETAYLFMRLAVASIMIHHGQEKILSAEAFTKFAIDKYFSFLPPIGDSRVIWAYGAGAAQFAGPLLVSLGVFSRLANVAMAGTMIGATYYSIITTGLEGFPLSKMAARVPIFHNYGFEAPVLYFAAFAVCAAIGPGKISVAQALGWNDDKSLLGKLKQ